jgi:integrase/recombinase XerD
MGIEMLVSNAGLVPNPVLEPSNATIAWQERELIFSWLLQKKEGTTRRYYERILKEFFTRFPGVLVKDISIGHISVFLEERKHLSISSQNVAKNTISSLLSFCVNTGYLQRNPAVVLKSQRAPQKTSFRILNEEQVTRLIQFAEPGRDQVMLKVLYYTGVRVSELCSLTWGQFSIRSQGVQMVVIGKGNKTRSILISQELWREIEALRSDAGFRSSLEYGAQHAEGQADPKSRIFQSQKAKSITPTRVLQIVQVAAKRAKLTERVSPHWLRHCHATHALERGAPIHVVKQTLGHESLETTGQYLNAFPCESSGRYLVSVRSTTSP